MIYRVVFAPEAEAQLAALYRYISDQASPIIAKRYNDAIVVFCERLDSYPHRGTPRDDLRPGLRTMTYRRRVTIAYAIDRQDVVVLGIFYGGQDFAAIIAETR